MEKKEFTVTLDGMEFDHCAVCKASYEVGGRTALYLEQEGEPLADITVNIPGLGEDEIAVKNWSENDGMDRFVEENGLVEGKPVRYELSGYVRIPVYKMSEWCKNLANEC